MSLKNIMATLKKEGYIVKDLDQYLLMQNDKDEDRRWDINSPSSAGACPRSVVYSRLGYERDAVSVDARTRRIFDNGTHVHERLQKYLKDCGLLVMEEVPLFHDEYQVQGHTDGILRLNKFELGVLEIKSINTDGFRKLVDAKDEHKLQALIYMYCLETRRLKLKKLYKTKAQLDKYLNSKTYENFIQKHYSHLVSGSHYSAEEKFNFKLESHREADRVLWETVRPINKMIFLYEDKNTQELKEFCVKWDDELLKELLTKYEYINSFVEDKKIPPRPKEATSKSCTHCRWCNFKSSCWIV